MASPRRRKAAPLIARLEREPYRFDSSQIVRILEARGPEARHAGIRFRSSLSLAFPVSDVEAVTIPEDPAQAAEVTVNFIGLGGAMGPLPTPYTEYLNAAVRRRQPAGRDFLDLFNNRIVGSAIDLAKLFRPALQAPHPKDSRHAGYHYALLGLRTPAIIDTIPQLASSLLPLSALLNERPLSGHAIERAVSTMFGVPARVIPFRGGWMHIPHDQRTAIGLRGVHRTLGQDAMLGGRQWDQSAGITIEIGPLPLQRAEQLLPSPAGGTCEHDHIVALLDFMTGGDLEVELRLQVEGATHRSARLSGATPMRLGWTSWLHDTARGAPYRAGVGPRLGRSARLGAGEPAQRLGGRPMRTITLGPEVNVPVRTQTAQE